VEDAHTFLRASQWLASGEDTGFLAARETAAVRSLELRVASRRDGNRPSLLVVSTGTRQLRWELAPNPFSRPPRRTHADLEQAICHPFVERSDLCPNRTRLWGCVTADEELVLYTAPDLDAAFNLAFRRLARDVPTDDVEPVERIQLEVALCGGTYRPVRYALWIFNRKISRPPGSPPTWSPYPPSPETPPAVEARLPVPTYSWTTAVGRTHDANEETGRAERPGAS
jgi:hypothetical protein